MRYNGQSLRKLIGVMLILAGVMLALAGRARGDNPPASGDMPRFQNVHLETRSLQGTLKGEISRWEMSSAKARWLGYAVPAVSGEHTICCWNHSGRSDEYCLACSLEGHDAVHVNAPFEGNGKVHLEGPRKMVVLVRAEAGKITKVRELSMECVVDAGGLTVLWLENVAANESVAFLQKLVVRGETDERSSDSVEKGALAALALHADASADRALESLIAPEQPEWLRKEAASWLGEARGAEGFRTLQKMARNDPSTHVREQVTFALSVSREPGALDEMIRMAHEDQSSQVRGQALFWLAQKAGKKAEATITGAIQNDPDTEVKKKAVFALSQMPKDQGIPKLIEVAQTNKNPEVRKQVLFWLGQSQDPRALAFFEEILAK